MMENPGVYEKLLRCVLSEGGESADLFHEKREDARISYSSEGGMLPAYGFSEGMALRLFRDPFYGTIHIERPLERNIWRSASALKHSALARDGMVSIHEDSKRKSSKNLTEKSRRRGDCPRGEERNSWEKMLSGDYKDIAPRIEEIGLHLKEYSKEKLIFSIIGSFYRQKVFVYDSNGAAVEDEREGAILRIKTYHRVNSSPIYSDLDLEYSSAEEFKKKLDPRDAAMEVMNKTLARKGFVKAPDGEMPLVLKNGSGGVFIHEVVGHLFEADNPLIDSIYNEPERIPIGNHITIYDDPSLMVRGRYEYDDEGVKAKRKPLILSGEWAGLLHSKRTAARKDARAEGNGRRQSFRDLALPRTSAIFMENGELLPEDVVKSVKKGIFACTFGPSIFEESSGDFSIHVTSGNLIEDGKIGAPIPGILLLGNSLKVLGSIDLIAKDLQFDKTGLSCSKFGQRIPSSVGTPTMRMGLIRVVAQ